MSRTQQVTSRVFETLSAITNSALYPNALQQRRGTFIDQRLRHLMESFAIESRVVAPIPWVPIKSAMFGQNGV